MKYQEIIPLIKSALESVQPEIKQVFASPQTRFSKFPAVVFYPSTFDNEFATNRENQEVYQFRVYVIIGTKQAGLNETFEEILPKAVDAIGDKFRSDWNQGVIDNHRVWVVLSSGDWGAIQTQDGYEAYAELNLTIKVLTSVD